jgi:hypothetical protein
MAEAGGSNIEIAHKLSETEKHAPGHGPKWLEFLEILEAVVLALVAISTAWSSYEAARWSGVQAELYGQSTKVRVEAQGLEIRSGQERMYDASTVVEWMKATAEGHQNLAELFTRRFRPEFASAFQAWLKTDPLNNPDAPPGPLMMPEYRNAKAEQAEALEKQASEMFDRGNEARERSDDYVRVTVFLATVLLLMAISQRFRIHKVRVGLAALAMVLLVSALWRILTLPRI